MTLGDGVRVSLNRPDWLRWDVVTWLAKSACPSVDRHAQCDDWWRAREERSIAHVGNAASCILMTKKSRCLIAYWNRSGSSFYKRLCINRNFRQTYPRYQHCISVGDRWLAKEIIEDAVGRMRPFFFSGKGHALLTSWVVFRTCREEGPCGYETVYRKK